tara:strand:- start:125 stop:259 length:135 start_codon:yes stop_codon:yes gene_type:complete
MAGSAPAEDSTNLWVGSYRGACLETGPKGFGPRYGRLALEPIII